MNLNYYLTDNRTRFCNCLCLNKFGLISRGIAKICFYNFLYYITLDITYKRRNVFPFNMQKLNVRNEITFVGYKK